MEKKQSILGLIPLISYAETKGFDLQQIFDRHGFSIEKLSGEAVIDQHLEIDILSDVYDIFEDPLLGLRLGSKVTFTSYGTYAMLLMTAPTFMDALKTGMQFQSLSLLYSRMSMHYTKEWIELRYTMPKLNNKMKAFVADRDLMGSFLFVHEFFDQPSKYIAGMGVARPKPKGKYLREYKELLGVEVEFDQPYNWFRMPRSLVHMSMRHGNVLAHQVYRAQSHELLRKFHTVTEDIVAQTRNMLAGYDKDYPSVPEIAKLFSMSERTYRRKLDEVGMSYRGLLDEHMKERCLDMLGSPGMSIQSIAAELGYAESASFLRAFKRWTGLTPKQYIKQNPISS